MPNNAKVGPQTGLPQQMPVKGKNYVDRSLSGVQSSLPISERAARLPIPGIKQFNPDEGVIEDRPGWNDEGYFDDDESDQRADKPVAKPTKVQRVKKDPAVLEDGSNTVDKSDSVKRQEAWKKQQDDKKAAREQKQRLEAFNGQALAKELLAKGDFAGYAKSIGLSPQELLLLTNQAALSIPKEVKPLTEAEQLKKDIEDLKKSKEEFQKEIQENKYWSVRNSFTSKEIMPLISNADTYEFINNMKGGVDAAAAFIYEHMDDELQKGNKLTVKQVADEMETELYNTYVASLQKAKKIKKLQSILGNQQVEDETSVEPGEEDVDQPSPKIQKPIKQVQLGMPSSIVEGLKKNVNKGLVKPQVQEEVEEDDEEDVDQGAKSFSRNPVKFPPKNVKVRFAGESNSNEGGYETFEEKLRKLRLGQI